MQKTSRVATLWKRVNYVISTQCMTILKQYKYTQLFSEVIKIRAQLSTDNVQFNYQICIISIYTSVRTNSRFWNESNTEYLFDSKNLTNRIPSNYSFPENYSSSIRIPQTIRIVRKFEQLKKAQFLLFANFNECQSYYMCVSIMTQLLMTKYGYQFTQFTFFNSFMLPPNANHYIPYCIALKSQNLQA